MRSQRNPASKTSPVEKITVVALALFLLSMLSSPALSSATERVVVRDRSGRVIERKIIRGKRTEIRSPNGKLLRVEIRKKDRIEVRSPSGRLLETRKISNSK